MKDLLNSMNINTTNRYIAVEDAGATNFDAETYRKMIADLTDSEEVNITDDEAKHTFMYVVDNIMNGTAPEFVFITAYKKATKYVANHPWVLAKPDHSSSYTPKSTIDAAGNPKQKKGAKKAKAITFFNNNSFNTRKEWIQALVENVGLTPAAASTYHYNLNKGIWK